MTNAFDTKIHYIVTVPDWQPEEATPLQGFSLTLCLDAFRIRFASFLPSTVFDLSPRYSESLLVRRLCGLNPINVHPQSPRAATTMPQPRNVPFQVVMIGRGEEIAHYRKWAQSSVVPPLLVAETGGDIRYDQLRSDRLKQHFLEVCEGLSDWADDKLLEMVKASLESWDNATPRSLGYQVGGHATVTPNLMALYQFGYDDMVSGRFEADPQEGSTPYVEQIVKTANSVLAERDQIDSRPAEYFARRFPALNIFAPSMYAQMNPTPPKDMPPVDKRRFRTAWAMLSRQRGYNFVSTSEHQFEAVMGISLEETRSQQTEIQPHPLFKIRQLELALTTECMSMMAASDLSATIRLPNDINRTKGAVRQFAQHYRSDDPTSRKRLLAFRQVQARLAQAVPAELLQVINEAGEDIRVISDAHVEWLDLDGLPLGIRKNVSRVPVTPGNLFVEQMGGKPLIRLPTSAFHEILVISALKREDPIHSIFELAFEAFETEWRDRISVKFVEVSNEQELINAFNSFDGPIALFDGHGSHSDDAPAVLHLQDEALDIWQLRGKLRRVPPIIVLSACDTHAADRNHATTANGFLSLGARAVLASVFPLHALPAATFAARLIYRIATFAPAFVSMTGQAVTWTEIVSGMIRMQLLTDFLRQLQAKKIIDDELYKKIHLIGNMAINGISNSPFDDVVDALVNEGMDRQNMMRELELAVSNSSAMSYLNVGRPETILIDTDERLARVMEAISE